MNISVVLRSHKDQRILNCIQSIDKDVNDIVVVLTYDDDLAMQVKRTGARVFFAEPGSQGATIEKGVKKSKYDKVIVADSDCVFGFEYIPKISELLDFYDIARGRLRMLKRGGIKGIPSRMVATNREYVYNIEKHMFMPGLGFRKSLAPQLGGMIFDPTLVRAVDFDFEQRAIEAGCSFFFDERVEIIHDIEEFSHDIKAAWYMGKSTKRLALNGRIPLSICGSNFRIILSCLGVSKLHLYKQISRNYGLLTAFYHHLWSVAFHISFLLNNPDL